MIPPVPDTPNFAEWQRQPLVDWANEAYTKLQQLHHANEQLRLDLKDSMRLLREATTNKDDWK